MEAQQYSPITPAEVVTFRQEAAQAGYPLPDGNSGQAPFHGGDLILAWDYDGSEVLKLGIVKNSILFCWNSTVFSELQKFMPQDVTVTPITMPDNPS
jgi:hypothetical protein